MLDITKLIPFKTEIGVGIIILLLISNGYLYLTKSILSHDLEILSVEHELVNNKFIESQEDYLDVTEINKSNSLAISKCNDNVSYWKNTAYKRKKAISEYETMLNKEKAQNEAILEQIRGIKADNTLEGVDDFLYKYSRGEL